MEDRPFRKPPWTARTTRDQKAMIDFVVGELLAEDVDNAEWSDRQQLNSDAVERIYRRAQRESAKQEARRGNVDPLRALIASSDQADLTEFIDEPKRVRGQRRPIRPSPEQCLQRYGANLAGRAGDVERVRAIWKREYGHWKRHRGERPYAEEIVSAYYAMYSGD
jgi:hypothetical protein